ncbi:hypothetical protein EVB91_209 [Rhizobium phage RHph_I1_18]|nr:hypothetical protein EVB91_209 [Rhizobium phage RHph_I1_18]
MASKPRYEIRLKNEQYAIYSIVTVRNWFGGGTVDVENWVTEKPTLDEAETVVAKLHSL